MQKVQRLRLARGPRRGLLPRTREDEDIAGVCVCLGEGCLSCRVMVVLSGLL